jgi:hypothetical protein
MSHVLLARLTFVLTMQFVAGRTYCYFKIQSRFSKHDDYVQKLMENLSGLHGCKEPDILRNIGLGDKRQVESLT